MSSLRPTCVSAPGKVLLVGGYVVLDEHYSGLVLSSTARFYSQVEAKARFSVNASVLRSNLQVLSNESTESVSSEWRRLFPLAVESKQFNQLVDGWIEENGGRFRLQLRENSHRNSYIEETVLCAVNGVAGLEAFKSQDTFQQLKETKMGVHVLLRGDNDFYSQVHRLQEAKLPLCRTNLHALEAFLPPTMEERGGKLVALKTGMGSSAALVTSLVAALVNFFVPTMNFATQQKDLELVHNLAQLSHCYVQRKIGSGFDVSAACFGSQRYTRFPASILNDFTSEEAMKPEEIADCITDNALWNISNRVKSVRLPSSFHLMMGDVSSGSATVSMVRQVTKWQKEQPEHAKRVMDEIHRHNLDVEQGCAEICELEENYGNSVDWKMMAAQGREQWGTTDAKIGAVLLRLNEAFSRFRDLMREMGTSAGVPIEPPEQTAILDATLAIPGVLLAGVPGAGGYDAICVVVIHKCALQAVEDLWVQWPITHPNSILGFNFIPLSSLVPIAALVSKRKIGNEDDVEDTGSFSDDGKESMMDNQEGELSFYTANVGDCRAVMCRGGQSVALTSDHKPDRPDEKLRIERAGGFVDNIAGISRVYSAAGAGLAMQREASTYLAVSRAFGDKGLKTPTPLVSCEPEVNRFTVHQDDLFIVLACDGVWDVLSEQDVVDIALPQFHDSKAAADAIVKAAYKKGSLDNLTATVIQFGWKSDAQLRQALENSKMLKSKSSKGRNDAPAEADNGSEEEIDMFNL
ncbi:Phosphomevalonate kinase [Phytophthora megakarya]|uniref:phosphomevalonate kinase n=1 Tax=Phytophthora megakarya TaxID=4795 RepID=A0A225WUE9_9STRA|nr:Phosphomevalonate kinase [Phytophthora megakarya]